MTAGVSPQFAKPSRNDGDVAGNQRLLPKNDANTDVSSGTTRSVCAADRSSSASLGTDRTVSYLDATRSQWAHHGSDCDRRPSAPTNATLIPALQNDTIDADRSPCPESTTAQNTPVSRSGVRRASWYHFTFDGHRFDPGGQGAAARGREGSRQAGDRRTSRSAAVRPLRRNHILRRGQGITDASATRRPSTPRTRRSG